MLKSLNNHAVEDFKILTTVPTRLSVYNPNFWLLLVCILILPFQATGTNSNCTGPLVVVNAKTIVLIGQTGQRQTGSAKLIYRDIVNRITDSCDGDLTFASGKILMERILSSDPANPTVPRTLTPNGTTTGLIGNAGLIDGSGNPSTDGLTFFCADMWEKDNIRVWAKNNAGNWRFGVATVTVQDNEGICETPQSLVFGTVGTEAGAPVKDAVISATANGIVVGSAPTSASGTFAVYGTSPNINYQIRATKAINSDKRNGVTTLDLALISKHILGDQLLNSPYKIIAADVNQDGEVDALDMLILRRFLLNITQTLPRGAWRFIDKNYVFQNPTNPLGENFPEFINFIPLPTNRSTNFIAVKLGDVNNSFDATVVR